MQKKEALLQFKAKSTIRTCQHQTREQIVRLPKNKVITQLQCETHLKLLKIRGLKSNIKIESPIHNKQVCMDMVNI